MEREVGLGSLGYMFVDVSFFRTHIIFFPTFLCAVAMNVVKVVRFDSDTC